MHHLPEHTNQDITRRRSKDKDSTVNKTEYQSKRNPTGKPRWARQTAIDQAPTISSTDKSLSRDRHRVWSPTHRRAIKEERKVANHDWVDHEACSLLQYINVIANPLIMGNNFNEQRTIRSYIAYLSLGWNLMDTLGMLGNQEFSMFWHMQIFHKWPFQTNL